MIFKTYSILLTKLGMTLGQGFPNSFFKLPPLGNLKRQSPPKTFFHLQLENI